MGFSQGLVGFTKQPLLLSRPPLPHPKYDTERGGGYQGLISILLSCPLHYLRLLHQLQTSTNSFVIFHITKNIINEHSLGLSLRHLQK